MRDAIENALIRGAVSNSEAREFIEALGEVYDATAEIRRVWESGNLGQAVTRLSKAVDKINS